MRDEHCLAIVAALYQNTAALQPRVPFVSDQHAVAWAKNLLDEAKRVVSPADADDADVDT